jgi:hypothetical protein
LNVFIEPKAPPLKLYSGFSKFCGVAVNTIVPDGLGLVPEAL